MKIAIIGYGKMGRLIEKIALERGHEITCIIDREDSSLFDSEKFKEADVAIEFTQPDAAAADIMKCFDAGVPVVSGTTGWLDRMPEIKQMCDNGSGTLLWSSNFSIGMNIFMAVNRYLASIMNNYDNYEATIGEVHHVHKLDHPSGTAISLANDIILTTDRITGWYEPEEGKELDNKKAREEGKLPIYHKREGEVPGIHTVIWDSGYDTISITHSAKSRDGFALGAVIAAEWLKGKKGFFTMKDYFYEKL